MTVAELIEKLKEFDQTMHVVVIKPYSDGDIDLLKDFEIDERYICFDEGNRWVTRHIKTLFLG